MDRLLIMGFGVVATLHAGRGRVLEAFTLTIPSLGHTYGEYLQLVHARMNPRRCLPNNRRRAQKGSGANFNFWPNLAGE